MRAFWPRQRPDARACASCRWRSACRRAGLLISCAMPAVRRPIAASRSAASISRSSRRLSSSSCTIRSKRALRRPISSVALVQPPCNFSRPGIADASHRALEIHQRRRHLTAEQPAQRKQNRQRYYGGQHDAAYGREEPRKEHVARIAQHDVTQSRAVIRPDWHRDENCIGRGILDAPGRPLRSLAPAAVRWHCRLLGRRSPTSGIAPDQTTRKSDRRRPRS